MGDNTTGGVMKQDVKARGRWRSLKRKHLEGGIAKQDVMGRGHWRSRKMRHGRGGSQ